MAGITPEEYAGWMHPRAALDLLAEDYGNYPNAAAAIFERLRGGRVQAASETWRQRTRTGNRPALMDNADWGKLETIPSHSRFWNSSDIEIEIGETRHTVTTTFYGVRFKPEHVRALLTKRGAAAAPAEEDDKPDPKLTDVSSADLAKWAALFAEVYPGATQALALKSAKGFFPDKNVSRNRVFAAMIEKRKRGVRG